MKNLMKFLVLTVWLALEPVGLAFAAPVPVRLEWTANPASENVIRYHIFREDAATGLKHFLAESTGTTATVDLEPGEHRLVAACENAHGWSAFSEAVVVTVKAAELPPVTPPAISVPPRFILQSSPDLTKWTDEIEILNKPPGAKFWRIVTRP